MAKAAAATVDASAGEAPKAGKKKLLIIIAALLVVLGGGGAAAFFVLGGQGQEGAEEAGPPPEPVGAPVFAVLNPFVVNLAAPDGDRFLQIGITYELRDNAASEQMKNYDPVIRSRILMVLSSKTMAELTSIQGKQRLMDELVDLARLTVNGAANDPTKGVRDVHFSSFVIQ